MQTGACLGGDLNRSFGCEGGIPGWGFGCNGPVPSSSTTGEAGVGATPPNSVHGSFTTADGPCAHAKGPQRFNSWVIVTDANNKASEPYHLRQFKCKSKRKKRH